MGSYGSGGVNVRRPHLELGGGGVHERARAVVDEGLKPCSHVFA
jgi:hypothetical protein